MKGKLVNIFIGFLNLIVGALILFYTLKIPDEITVLTVQENEVVNILKIVIYAIIVITGIINLLGFLNNKTKEGLKFGYKLFLFTLFFILIKLPIIAALPILSGLLIITSILKDNLREVESTLAISVIAVVFVASLLTGGLTYFYESIGSYILAKKNENQLKYTNAYFKYITELEDVDKYVNLKKDGKYGYIDLAGNVVIDFKYDFASPFTTINVYNKNFDVALVCENGISKIIMKNERVVKSYVSESSDENYEAKIEELKNFCKKEIGMSEDEIHFEIESVNNKINKVPVYDEEKTEDYTYRYDFNDRYDIIVVNSSMGFSDSYYFAKKDNLNYKIKLTCEKLDYDENYLYLYNDGTLPYYSLSTNEQGWYDSNCLAKTLKGNAQILDKIGDAILYRDYTKDGKVKFVNQSGESLSDTYKEIYLLEDRYIVKNNNDKYTVIDSKYNKIFQNEYDYVDTSLAEYGLYLFGNVDDVIEFNDYGYAKMNFTLLNSEGNVIMENLEQVYLKYYEMNSNDENKVYVSKYNDFIDSVETMDFEFVGDSIYNK